ncbi:MAG: prolipoprotein diacylglyceryl transferase [Candidatus Ornithomonoglobus sp.]
MTNVISFPRLGITLNISPVAFHIGQKGIYWYALIILAGFLAGLLLASYGCEKRGIKKDHVWDIALLGIVCGIIGARIYYVIFSFDEFRGDLMGVFRIWEGGLAIYGGIIGAVISTCIYCKIRKINILNALDVCCIGLLLGQCIGRWGNFTNCEVFGRATDFFLGMSINGAAPVHPLFFYESMWSLLGVILLLLFRDKKQKNGQIVCGYLLWYSAGRLALEGMRDTGYILYLIPGVLGISQLVAALLIAVSIAGFIFITKSDKPYFKKLPAIVEVNRQ